jgi:hypothetical protein
LNETIGQRLDDADRFFQWINHAALSIAVLKAAVGSDLCAHLSDVPISIDELAARCAIPADNLRRLVDYLAAEEVVSMTPDGKVRGTARSTRMRELSSMIMVQSRTAEVGPFLLEGLRGGISAYEARFGKPVFSHLPEQPEMSAHFSHFMGYLTRRVEQFVFTQHEFEPFECVVDVGGSHGSLLKGLLAKFPQARGVLFDLPETAALVTDAIRASPQGDRIEIVGGSFFEAVPAGDLHILKMVLHDWNDAECVSILKSVRAAMAPRGRVAVIDYLLTSTGRPSPSLMMDVAMMVWATGRERRLPEFEALFAQAGLRLDRVSENPQGQSVMEAVRA